MSLRRRELLSLPSVAGTLRYSVILTVLATACDTRAPEGPYVRGLGVSVAKLSPNDESRVVEAAIREAFDVEPALTLRVHPRRLPRTAGDSGGDAVPNALVQSLRARGLVLGSCDPIRTSTKGIPRCSGPEAGYIIRASDVFAISPDTFEINLAAEKFGAATGPIPAALRFEKAYQLVREGQRWRVAREGRVRQ